MLIIISIINNIITLIKNQEFEKIFNQEEYEKSKLL